MTSDSRTHHQKSSLLRFVSNYLALLVMYIGETEKYFIDLLKFLNIFIFLNCRCVLKKSHYYFKGGSKSHICTECHATRKYTLCRRCSMCNSLCRDFEKETCSLFLKPPYICNGCGKRSSYSPEKRVYHAGFAHREYRDILSEFRIGRTYEDFKGYLLDYPDPAITQLDSVEEKRAIRFFLLFTLLFTL